MSITSTSSRALASSQPRLLDQVDRRIESRSISGWGNCPARPARELLSEDIERLSLDVPLSRGLGRSYGDASLPAEGDSYVASTVAADRMLSFDPDRGVLKAEAGLSLDQIYRTFLPRGFFVPVTPGTRFVTLGGMVASDVHGKNHHREGCIGRHVRSLTMRVADGRIVTCSPSQHPDLFRATIGGMGLTGHVLDVSLQLAKVPSPWIWQESERITDIDAFLDALRAAGPEWPFTAGWFDGLSGGRSLGRGILFKGRWAEPGESPTGFPRLSRGIPVPFHLPSATLQPAFVAAFNTAYFRKHIHQKSQGVVHPEQFFYPLDAVQHWNRLYGRRGFVQYQCVLPSAAGPQSVRRFLEHVVESGGAYLGVIKDCGPAESAGLLSFPQPGTSLALDIPLRHDTQARIDDMNELVIESGGRIYLTKDALSRAEHYLAMDDRVDEFLKVRRTWDPAGRFRSALSVRLFGW